MRNDVSIGAKLYISKYNVRKLSLNYYSDFDEEKMIGYIDVDEIGNMKWEIYDLNYKDYFFSFLPNIYGGDIENHISYESKEPDENRWTNLRVYLAINNISIDYSNEYNDLMNIEPSIRSR